MKALFAELTSVNFTAKLQGIQGRQGTQSAKAALRPSLQKYSDIKKTSQIVRSDLTNKQQFQLTQKNNQLKKSERDTHNSRGPWKKT